MVENSSKSKERDVEGVLGQDTIEDDELSVQGVLVPEVISVSDCSRVRAWSLIGSKGMVKVKLVRWGRTEWTQL